MFPTVSKMVLLGQKFALFPYQTGEYFHFRLDAVGMDTFRALPQDGTAHPPFDFQ
jgi:hypothetical protein